MPTLPQSFTFAFSKRLDSWTTRYSFVPTCYANSGDVLLSSKDKSGVWKHDSLDQRNSFYGVNAPSSLTVISNDDPSAIKMYKSISLETNKSEWNASFSSNSEYTDHNNQSSLVVNGFVDKEAFKYRDIPRSTKNSTANLAPCMPFGNLVLVQYGLTAQGIQDADFSSLMAFAPQESHTPIPKGKLLAKQNGAVVDFSVFTSGAWNNIYVSPEYMPSGVADGSELIKIDASLNQVLLDDANNYIAAGGQLLIAINNFLAAVVYVETNASVNGDMMRGPYLKTSLSINTSEPLEINAINVEYEFSKLDKRLNQNT